MKRDKRFRCMTGITQEVAPTTQSIVGFLWRELIGQCITKCWYYVSVLIVH